MNEQTAAVIPADWMDRDEPPQKLQYDGRLGALYWIFFKNLLLNIVTLTFYRFWGKTNLRRYVWSHVTLQGERFEYTGRGGELFVGFLIVVGFYIVAGLMFGVATLVFGPGLQIIGNFVVAILILYFVFVAQYAAQKYRLTRTLWMGIRGGMTGSAWKYGVKAFLFTLLSLVTLNLATPWVTMRLAEDRFNNSYFGNAKASLQASAKPLYVPFILGLVGVVAGAIVLGIVLGVVAYGVAMSGDMLAIMTEVIGAAERGVPPDLTDEQQAKFSIFIFVIAFVFYLGVAVVGLLAFAPYMAATFRTIAGNLRLADLQFSSEVTAWRYVRLWFGNILWVVLTFGIGIPVAVHRSIRFFVDRVNIHGAVDVERLQQTSLDRPKFGEGLLEAFDPGFL